MYTVATLVKNIIAKITNPFLQCTLFLPRFGLSNCHKNQKHHILEEDLLRLKHCVNKFCISAKNFSRLLTTHTSYLLTTFLYAGGLYVVWVKVSGILKHGFNEFAINREIMEMLLVHGSYLAVVMWGSSLYCLFLSFTVMKLQGCGYFFRTIVDG